MDDANERAWKQAIDELNLDRIVSERGVAEVTADQLRQFREPRLMAKMDKLSDLPNCFSDRGWSLLSISNEAYLVGPIRTHIELPAQIPHSKTIYWEQELDSLSPQGVTGETAAVMLAWHSGALSSFVGDELMLTHFGRQRSGNFSFSISTNTGAIQVTNDGSQIEIDAGFEGKQTIVLVEAKLGTAESLNVRQLYYPFRHWLGKTGKLVIPIFLTWQNNRLDLYQLNFPYFDDFGSAEVISISSNVFRQGGFSIAELERYAGAPKLLPNDYPFPQANSVEKIITTWKLLFEPKSQDQISTSLGIDGRQASYYLSALGFLGLAKKTSQLWESSHGPELASSNRGVEETLILRMLNVGPVAATFLHGNRYSRAQFSEAEAMRQLEMSAWGSNLSSETIRRRAQCIVSWCQWIDSRVIS